MNRLCSSLPAQGLGQKQQAVKAERERSFVSLEDGSELIIRRDCPKVNDAFGTVICISEFPEQQLIIFSTVRFDRERFLTQSFEPITCLHDEHILLRLLETLDDLCAESCAVDEYKPA